MKPKGMTAQMKALSEYILMALFVLLLKRVFLFAFFQICGSEKFSEEGSGGCHLTRAQRSKDLITTLQ